MWINPIAIDVRMVLRANRRKCQYHTYQNKHSHTHHITHFSSGPHTIRDNRGPNGVQAKQPAVRMQMR